MSHWVMAGAWGALAAVAFSVGEAHPSSVDFSAATAPSPSLVSEDALSRALAERDAELQKLKARLVELDDAPAYEEAESLGVVGLVQKSKLPDRQQRRLSVAV